MNKYLQFLIVFALISLSGCTKQKQEITNLSMLKGGKTFAVPTGTVADQMVLDVFPDAVIKYYNSVLDCALAVKAGKADAGVYDRPVLLNIAGKNDGLKVLQELLKPDSYGFAVQMDKVELKTTIDALLDELKANGTYDEMMKRWFPTKGDPAPMPKIELSGKNGVFRFGTAAVTEPMSFVDGNRNFVGFDIEFATYVAKKLDKQIEIVNMEFGAMLPALISGKVDMIGAGLSITEERAKKVLFSKCYYDSGIAAIVKDNGTVTEPAKGTKLKSVDDLKKRNIGVLLGSVHDTYATKNFPDATIFQYQNVSDLLLALNSEKVDAVFMDHFSLKDIFATNKELDVLGENVFTVPIAAGFNKESNVLREQFNAFLKEIKANGVYADMTDRWMVKSDTEMPVIESKKNNGKLTVGIVSDLGLPSTITKDGKLAGFDIELVQRFAANLGKEYVPVDLPFSSILASLSTKKIDLAACSMMISEERKKQINFSDPYYESGVSIISKKSNLEKYSGETKAKGAKLSFWAKISDSFYSNIILEKRYLLITNGLKVTIFISIFAALLGTLLGGLVCFMRMSKRKILSASARIYISLLRGTPVLVLLMIIYYIVFASVNINPVLVAIFAFGLNFAAYVSEMFRTSIESIDKGQKEAGIAGGFTKVQTFIYIILPQALRHVLPVYKGEFISLVKMTSIVGYIAVQDLTKASDIIRSRTFDAFFPLIMAAVVYLALAWLLTWALGYVEVSVDPKRKSIKRELEVN